MNGTTSVAPMRGCSPLMGLEIDQATARAAMPAKAASATASAGATKVTTVRLCDVSDETSRIATPGTAAIASRICADDLGAPALGEIGDAFDRAGMVGTGLGNQVRCSAGLRERVEEPGVDVGVAGDDRWCGQRGPGAPARSVTMPPASRTRRIRPRYPTGRASAPRTHRTGRQATVGQIERRRAGAPHAGGVARDRGELRLVVVERFEMREWEAGADQGAGGLRDRGTR